MVFVTILSRKNLILYTFSIVYNSIVNQDLKFTFFLLKNIDQFQVKGYEKGPILSPFNPVRNYRVKNRKTKPTKDYQAGQRISNRVNTEKKEKIDFHGCDLQNQDAPVSR